MKQVNSADDGLKAWPRSAVRNDACSAGLDEAVGAASMVIVRGWTNEGRRWGALEEQARRAGARLETVCICRRVVARTT